MYLTADSPNELETVDTGKVYVIGGIVDRNRHKCICLKRAEAAGVAHARLPIQKNVTLSTSAVSSVCVGMAGCSNGCFCCVYYA